MPFSGSVLQMTVAWAGAGDLVPRLDVPDLVDEPAGGDLSLKTFLKTHQCTPASAAGNAIGRQWLTSLAPDRVRTLFWGFAR